MCSDDELYRSFLAGDTDSYDKLMIRYGNSRVFYLNGYIHDIQDAEDLMIEAFARIMVKRPRIREGSFKAYLYRTARNLASRFHEKHTHVKIFGFEELNKEVADTVLTEDVLADINKKEALHLCLERIEPSLKEALWLFYFEELSYAQIGEVMGLRSKQVDHLLSKAKEEMRKEMIKEGYANAHE